MSDENPVDAPNVPGIPEIPDKASHVEILKDSNYTGEFSSRNPPHGMSKSAWKRELKKRKWEAERPQYIQMRKEKRKQKKEAHRKERLENGTSSGRPSKIPIDRTKREIKVIIDCAFDDLMKETESLSMVSQIVRCYSTNRRAPVYVDLEFSSFNKRILNKFETSLQSQHLRWTDVTVRQDDFDIKNTDSMVYLSSDSDTVLHTLEEGKTYIIGGIVDKGRHRNLCKNKAEAHNIPTARLPIDEYIKLSGRRVLTTNHVFELMLKYLETNNWKTAFELILPSRKLISSKESDKTKDEDKSQSADKSP